MSMLLGVFLTVFAFAIGLGIWLWRRDRGALRNADQDVVSLDGDASDQSTREPIGEPPGALRPDRPERYRTGLPGHRPGAPGHGR